MLNVYQITFEDRLVEIISEISAYEARRTATWCGTRTAHGPIVKFEKIGEVCCDEEDVDAVAVGRAAP